MKENPVILLDVVNRITPLVHCLTMAAVCFTATSSATAAGRTRFPNEELFSVKDHTAFLIFPKDGASSRPIPWVLVRAHVQRPSGECGAVDVSTVPKKRHCHCRSGCW